MSIQSLSWALNQEIFPSSHKFVLVALANYVGDTGKSYPGIKTICDLTSLKEDAVRNALAALVDSGIVEDTGQRTGSTSQVKVYQLPDGAWEKKSKFESPDRTGSLKTGVRLGKDPVKTRERPGSIGSPNTIDPGTGNQYSLLEREIASEVEPPISRKEFDRMVELRGYDKDCADWFWHNCDGVGWLDQYGRKILKVESLLINALRSWKGREYKKPNGSLPIWRQIEGLEEEIGKHIANSESVFHRNNCTDLEKADLRAKRIKLRELKAAK